jgi:DNA primase
MSRTAYVDFKTVKAAVSMLQILDHYQITERLKRSGDNLSGCCPLHDGSNPTQFRVSLSKNCWNCFGKCKRGGNILDFVALKDGIPLREAALKICEWFDVSPGEPSDRNGESNISHARESSCVVPKKESASEAEPNKPLGFELKSLDAAHPYLKERGLNDSTIAEFGLGLCSKGSMTGRIVIPIHNAEGKLVAYSGRYPGDPLEDTPKYKLPPGFHKAQELFNLHRIVYQPDDLPLIIVEGFFDCMMLWQKGVQKVVALMGSSLSPAQEELLVRFTSPEGRVIVMLDEDDAGRSGREDIARRLELRMFVKVFRFDSEGQQPEQLSSSELEKLSE